MKVKVKRGTSQSMIPGIFVTVLFGAFCTFIYIKFFNDMKGDYSVNGLMKALEIDGFFLIFALVFSLVTLFLIFQMVKPPRKYLATLIEKKYEVINGNDVTSMEFKVEAQKKSIQYIKNKFICYANGHNDLTVGNKYNILIKEFNWRIRAVEDAKDNNALTVMANLSMKPVLIVFGGVFGGGFLLGLSFLIINLTQGKPILWGIILMIICTMFIIGVIICNRLWNKDNALTPQIATGNGPGYGNETLPVALLGSKEFKVERKTLSTRMEKYIVLDKYEQIVYEIDEQHSLQRTMIIKDDLNNEIGCIKNAILDATEKFIVNLNGYPEFSVRKKVTLNALYEVTGLDYKVEGNRYGTDSSIFDLNDKLQATVNMQEGTFGRRAGYTNVTLAPDVENNIFLVFIATCVTIGNFHVAIDD